MLSLNKPAYYSYSSKVEKQENQQVVKNFSKIKDEVHVINKEHHTSLKETQDKLITDYLTKTRSNLT